jgi:hypothetical protein
MAAAGATVRHLIRQHRNRAERLELGHGLRQLRFIARRITRNSGKSGRTLFGKHIAN